MLTPRYIVDCAHRHTPTTKPVMQVSLEKKEPRKKPHRHRDPAVRCSNASGETQTWNISPTVDAAWILFDLVTMGLLLEFQSLPTHQF